MQIHLERVLYHFAEIAKIPRPSGREEKIAAYLCEWACKNGFSCDKDQIGNLSIRTGENEPDIALQAHMDMVCVSHPQKKYSP